MSTMSLMELPWQCGLCSARFFKEELMQMHAERFHSGQNHSPDVIQKISKIMTDDGSGNTYHVEVSFDNDTNSHPEADVEHEQGQVQESEQAVPGAVKRECEDEVSVVFVNKDGTIYSYMMQPEDQNSADTVGGDSALNEKHTIQAVDTTVDENTTQQQLIINIQNDDDILESEETTANCDVMEESVVLEDSQVVEQEDVIEEDVVEEYLADDPGVVDERMQKLMYAVSDARRTSGVRYRETPTFPCTKCDQVFSTRHDRRMHLQSHVNDKRFFCGVCERGFAKMALLKLHLNSHVVGRRFKCQHCHKSYKSEAYLKKHTELHTGSAEHDDQLYECGACGTRCVGRKNLALHMLHVHNGQRICRACGQAYIGSGYNWNRCATCRAKFRGEPQPDPSSSQGVGHMEPLAEPERPYACAEPGCIKAFRHPGHLRRHLTTHFDDFM